MSYWKQQTVKYTKQSQYKHDTIVTQQDLQNIENSFKINQFYQIQPAEVIQVILLPINENVGKMCYVVGRLLSSAWGLQKNQKIYIKPLYNNIHIPVVGELVLTIKCPSIQSYDTSDNTILSQSYYYYDIVSFCNSQNHNSVKNITNTIVNNQVQGDKNFLIGSTFRNNPNIHKVIPLEGDTMIQSRFGSLIHFTSQSGSGLSPSIYITNNINTQSISDIYVRQNINLDGSSIYLSSVSEPIMIDLATNKYTTVQSISELINDQIILNSDKIFLNSKLNQVAIFGNTNILLSANDIIGVQATGVNIKAIQSIQLSTKQTTIASDKILIGSIDSEQPIVLGNKLLSLLEDLIDQITNITVMSPIGVTATPINTPKLLKIKQNLTSFLSKKCKTE